MSLLMVTRQIAIVAAVAAALFAAARPTHAGPAERAIEFQDGNGSVVLSVEAGSSAGFYVSDPGLTTVLSGAASWAALPALVPANSWWSLATGAPHPGVLTMIANGYSSSTPALTPLASVPTATVNGVPFLLSGMEADTGRFALLNDVNISSSVEIEFAFDIVDFHDAAEKRARVFSGSDLAGEWVSLAEIASGSDASASPTSGLFRGEAGLSIDAASVGQGDGAVWVQPGDTVTVTYYELGGAEAVSSHEVQVSFPAVGLPAAGPWALAVLALGLTAAGVWGLRRAGKADGRFSE